MEIFEVKISASKEDTGKEIANRFFQACHFCEKLVKINQFNFKSCCNLSGNQFFCPFCIRNNFHYRSNRNVLILSFRAIIGYYYYRKYRSLINQMYLSEIMNMLDRHVMIGMLNPTLCYDQFTMLWFVDFNKIGNDPRKAPIEEIETTISSILHVFKLNNIVKQNAYDELWKKYQEAIELFYHKRQRPKDRRMLIPTLNGIVFGEKPEFFEKTRDFIYSDLEIL